MADMTFRCVDFAPVADGPMHDSNLQVDAEIGDDLVLSLIVEPMDGKGVPTASLRITGAKEVDALRRYCEMALAHHAAQAK